MLLSNKVYDCLKWIAMYLLPALGTLYFAVAQIWGLPYTEQVVGTITALDAFLGAILGISSNSYKGDGTFVVNTTDPEKDIYRFEIDEEVLDDIPKRSKITLKIKDESQDLQAL